MCEKYVWETEILSNDGLNQTVFLLKMSLPQVFFTHFAGKNQLPGFSISGTLAWNGLSMYIFIFKTLGLVDIVTCKRLMYH